MTDPRGLRIASGVLIFAGVLFLALTIFHSRTIDFTLPLIFLTLGPGFVVLVFTWSGRWRYAPLLYMPAGLFTALGMVFLLNVVSGDWQAWSYAWLLPVAGLGVGAALAAIRTPLPDPTWMISLVIALVGIALFGVFGAIVGGMFIRLAAPLMLVAGGLGLRYGWFKRLMAEGRARSQLPAAQAVTSTQATAPTLTLPANKPAPVEALSAREQEVLCLIDQGLTNQQIAARLTLAPSTVKTHINNIYGKLEVQTRLQAVNKARELGYLEENEVHRPGR